MSDEAGAATPTAAGASPERPIVVTRDPRYWKDHPKVVVFDPSEGWQDPEPTTVMPFPLGAA